MRMMTKQPNAAMKYVERYLGYFEEYRESKKCQINKSGIINFRLTLFCNKYYIVFLLVEELIL